MQETGSKNRHRVGKRKSSKKSFLSFRMTFVSFLQLRIFFCPCGLVPTFTPNKRQTNANAISSQLSLQRSLQSMARLCWIRSALPPPAHPDGLCTACDQKDAEVMIKLRHPGYPDNKNVLLVFPALDPIITDGDDNGDNTNGTKVSFGLHHETARLACAVAANNRWDGFLSTDKATDATPLQLRPDEILAAGSYYFHVPRLDGLPWFSPCP